MAEGMKYHYSASVATVTTALYLAELTAPSDAVVVIDRISLQQSTLTDSEIQQAIIVRGATAAVGGTTVTPQPDEVGMAAAGGTYKKATWTTAPVAAAANLILEGFNVLSGYVWHPTPEERIVLSPSGILLIGTGLTATSSTWTVSVHLREIGG